MSCYSQLNPKVYIRVVINFVKEGIMKLTFIIFVLVATVKNSSTTNSTESYNDKFFFRLIFYLIKICAYASEKLITTIIIPE